MKKSQAAVQELAGGLEAALAERKQARQALERRRGQNEAALIEASEEILGREETTESSEAVRKYTAILLLDCAHGRSSVADPLRDYVESLRNTGVSAREVIAIHIRALDSAAQVASDHEAPALLESSRDLLTEVLVNLVDLYRASTEGEPDEVHS